MVPRWQPGTEADLLLADTNGLFDEESHFLEFKRELPTGAPSNKELARDLASFAIDGGLILIGVRDKRHRPPTLNPVDLGGLAERVEQVALSAVDPPVFVACYSIESVDFPGQGYLVVEIPPSVDAPHQVDGTYYGRGDRTKRGLSDREVVLTMSLRAGELVEVEKLREQRVDEFFRALPGGDEDTLPTITLVAIPRPVRIGMMLKPGMGQYSAWLRQVVFGQSPGEDMGLESPFSTARQHQPDDERRLNGWRLVYKGRPWLFDLSLGESGEASLSCAQLGSVEEVNGVTYSLYDESAILALVVQFGHLLDRISRDAHFDGRWDLALSLTGLSGRMSKVIYQKGGNPGNLFPQGGAYEEATFAQVRDLAFGPYRIADRLLARLVRAAEIEGLDVVNQILRRPPYGEAE